MELRFAKWHGTGNDFVVVDDRAGKFPVEDQAAIRGLCDRHFGIGSDGLILVRPATSPGLDFHMEFFNPDGSRSFCGNGSRCAFAFWSALINGADNARFTATDGEHEGRWDDASVSIALRNVAPFLTGEREPHVDNVNTGSPHELVWVDDPEKVDVVLKGRARRNAAHHLPSGTNVNFLTVEGGVVHMRTYERGVEAETLSCGTGVVAAALGAIARGSAVTPVDVITPGGRLRVFATGSAEEGFIDIRLVGPVKEVFTGTISI